MTVNDIEVRSSRFTCDNEVELFETLTDLVLQTIQNTEEESDITVIQDQDGGKLSFWDNQGEEKTLHLSHIEENILDRFGIKTHMSESKLEQTIINATGDAFKITIMSPSRTIALQLANIKPLLNPTQETTSKKRKNKEIERMQQHYIDEIYRATCLQNPLKKRIIWKQRGINKPELPPGCSNACCCAYHCQIKHIPEILFKLTQ